MAYDLYHTTGVIPEDTTPAADKARKAAAAQVCPANPMTEKPKPRAEYTVAEVVDYLRTLKPLTTTALDPWSVKERHWAAKNAEFAASLVAYYDRKGTLTEKQEAAARKMFRQHHDRLMAIWEGSGCHRWQWSGRQKWGNLHSAAYSQTDYFRCEHCGEFTQQYERSDYSGDF